MLSQIKTFFANKTFKKLTYFYNNPELLESTWHSLAINKMKDQKHPLSKELSLTTKNIFFDLKIIESKNTFQHLIYKNQQSFCEVNLEKDSSSLLEFNSLFDKLITQYLKTYCSILNNNFQQETYKTDQIQNEEKALEWLKVSFSILEKAIVESLTNPDLLFQTLLFFGKNPKTLNDEIRLITFNLDIKFEILNTNRLRIVVYNDKFHELGHEKKPSLSGDFHFRAKEMVDELIKLISAHANGIKFIF